MAEINFRLATDQDDKKILALVHSLSMPGDIEVVYQRFPSFFYGSEIQGFKFQILLACNENDEVLAVGGRSLKKAYVNGEEKNVGYLSDLRIGKNARHMHILANGYKEMKKLMLQNEDAYLHLTTIIEDNKLAQAALTWKNKHKSIPNYFDIGRINTYFILPIFRKKRNNDFTIRKGTIEALDDIIRFLNQEGRKKQFFPVYTREYFLNLRDFNISDFYLAYSEEKIVGVVAKWKQSGFKQVILKKYNGKMKWIKKLLGHLLPDENKEIEHIYLSFIATKNNSPNIFQAILSHIYSDVYRSGIKYFVVGFHEKDNLQIAMKKYFKVTYKSRLYVAEYKTDEEIKQLIDDRIPYVEVSTL